MITYIKFFCINVFLYLSFMSFNLLSFVPVAIILELHLCSIFKIDPPIPPVAPVKLYLDFLSQSLLIIFKSSKLFT